jgi:hypothetical protein
MSKNMKRTLVILISLIPLIAGGAEQLDLDIDCDGKIDTAKVENTKDKAKVSVTIAKDSSVHVLEFGLGNPGLQSSLCGNMASISKETLDSSVSEAIGEMPEGYKVSEQCHGIRVSGGECDSMHIYWNHEKQTIYWWRL